jgi:hypothetical protein
MLIVAVAGRQELQKVVEIAVQSRVTVFVDEQGGGRVRYKEETRAVLHTGFRHNLLDKLGDVLELDSGVSLHLSGMEPGRSSRGGKHSACFR